MHAPARHSAPGDGKTLQIAGFSFSRPLSRILSWVTIHLGRRLPYGSSGVPDPSAGRVNGICFTLHRTGFDEPPRHRGAGGLLPHRFTLTAETPGERLGGGLLSVPLSVGFRPLGFPQRPALRCPDFPRRRHLSTAPARSPGLQTHCRREPQSFSSTGSPNSLSTYVTRTVRAGRMSLPSFRTGSSRMT